MKRRMQSKSFFAALSATLGAVVWLCNYAVSGRQILLSVGISAAALFLPWHRWRTAARLLWVIATAACFRLGVELIARLYPDLPEWGRWLGWGLMLGLLIYLGNKALYECAMLFGIVVPAALLFSVIGSFSAFDGVIEWTGTPWQRVTAAVVVLLGCALTGLELSPHKNAAKAGALSGILLWGAVAFIPLIMWSREALQIVSPALSRAWGRLGLLSFLSRPDILLCALSATAALWQSGVGVSMLVQMKNEK